MIATTSRIEHLARELERALAILPRSVIAVIHVRQRGSGPVIAECVVWVVREGRSPIWSRHRELPAGLGLTMRQIEHAILAAGHDYIRTDLGLRGAWRRARPNTYLLPLRRA